MFKTVGKWVNPPEAGAIAAHYRYLASEVREIAGRMRQTGTDLKQMWVGGNARARFSAGFDPLPIEIGRYADSLDQMASQIASIQVWVEERVPITS